MNRLIDWTVVAERCGNKSKSYVYKAVRAKKLPPPVEPGLWLESEVDACIAAKALNRSNSIGRPARGEAA